MSPGRGAHGDHLQFVVGEELVNVAEGFRPELFRELLRGVRPEVEHGMQFAAIHGLDGLAMELADHAGPDNSEFHERNGISYQLDAGTGFLGEEESYDHQDDKGDDKIFPKWNGVLSDLEGLIPSGPSSSQPGDHTRDDEGNIPVSYTHLTLPTNREV